MGQPPGRIRPRPSEGLESFIRSAVKHSIPEDTQPGVMKSLDNGDVEQEQLAPHAGHVSNSPKGAQGNLRMARRPPGTDPPGDSKCPTGQRLWGLVTLAAF